MSALIVVIDTAGQASSEHDALLEEMVSHCRSQGGRYLAHGDDVIALGGDIVPTRVSIIEFDELAQAQSLASDERFVELRTARREFATSSAFIVEVPQD